MSEVEDMKESNVFVKAELLSWETVGEGVQRKILGYDHKIMMV